MAAMGALVASLAENGHTYTRDGSVYFKISSLPAYGRLARLDVEGMQAGARVDVDERKRSPMDFALWKSSKPGEPSWPSPWGSGRPGWHIECSAMSIKHLGETFDIHGGGMDLIFPHHENEIAQSCGATGKEFARYWIHNGFVQVNHEKMSKSLGNFFTIREIFEKSEWSEEVTGEILRYFLLSTHYHGPLDFSDQALKEAKNALNGFYDLFNRLAELDGGPASEQEQLQSRIEEATRAFTSAMDNDLNTPVALAAFQTFRSDVNKLVGAGFSTEARQSARRVFRDLGAVFGLFQLNRWEFKPPIKITPEPASLALTTFPPTVTVRGRMPDTEVEAKLAERIEAKKRKDFKRADELREELMAQGIIIEDKPDGTSRWKR